MSHKEISKGSNFLTCENYISLEDENQIVNFIKIAEKLNISILTLDGVSIEKRNAIIESSQVKRDSLISPASLYDLNTIGLKITQEIQETIKKFLYTSDEQKYLLVSRKTINENSVDKIRKQLGSIRNQYDIITKTSMHFFRN